MIPKSGSNNNQKPTHTVFEEEKDKTVASNDDLLRKSIKSGICPIINLLNEILILHSYTFLIWFFFLG